MGASDPPASNEGAIDLQQQFDNPMALEQVVLAHT
jgi:hypothetical protein